MNSFKTRSTILTGAWVVHADARQLCRRAASAGAPTSCNVLYTSLIVATRRAPRSCSSIGTLAAYSLYRFRWAHWVVARLPRLDCSRST